MVDSLLLTVSKQSKTNQKATKIPKVSAHFKQIEEVPVAPALKMALEFEKQVLSTSIEKIAMLDADVRIKGRRGAKFPSQLGYKTNWDGTNK